jgi:hypothetical protein
LANITTFPTASVDGGLSKFFREAWTYPILEKDEEYMLAKSYAEHDDTDAAHKLVTSHLRLVAKIAMGYRGYGLPVSDLVSEGSIGLMKAVKNLTQKEASGYQLTPCGGLGHQSQNTCCVHGPWSNWALWRRRKSFFLAFVRQKAALIFLKVET